MGDKVYRRDNFFALKGKQHDFAYYHSLILQCELVSLKQTCSRRLGKWKRISDICRNINDM
jgi:hypothetical protein